MNKEEFSAFWSKKYNKMLPINYLFNETLGDYWFRIHSLPKSKRYAESDEEYGIIFHRQNSIIDDLIPQNVAIKIVINFIEIANSLFSRYDFCDIGVFVDNDRETVFQSFLIETKWQTNAHNDLLKDIADDNIRAFIIYDQYLISPYDGGMDVYLNNTQTRDFYKNKYKKWLSKRADGL